MPDPLPPVPDAAATHQNGPFGKSPPPRRCRPKTEPLSNQEKTLLREATRTLRDRLIVEVGLLTGFRVSEICSLDVPDVDFATGTFRARGPKGKKAGPGKREGLHVVPMNARLAADLARYLGGRQIGPLFTTRLGGRFTRHGIRYLLLAIADRAGLTRRIHPHVLRHTFATNALAKTDNLIKVRDLMGHADVKTTQRYTHTSLEDLRSIVEQL